MPSSGSVAKWKGFPIEFDSIQFWIYPMRSLIADAFGLVVIDNMPSRARIVLPNSLLVAGFAILMLQAWAIVALSYRRVLDARLDAWFAAAAIAPMIQAPAILFLCVMYHGDRARSLRWKPPSVSA